MHLDGDPGNNRLSNLKYGSHSENMSDSLAHGTHYNASKESCPRGHPYDYFTPSGRRECRRCMSERSRRNYFRRKGFSDPSL